MPQDLPGFYYDAEKNRYFPIKGPIPGAKRNTASHNKRPLPKPNETIDKGDDALRRKRSKATVLLQFRELYGKTLSFNECKCNFQQEYQKLQASQPTVWKYQGTQSIADKAMEQFNVNIQTPQGHKEANVLLTGSTTGSISLFEVGKLPQQLHRGVQCFPYRVWPLIPDYEAESVKEPGHIRSSDEAKTHLPSYISSIKRIGKHSLDTVYDGALLQCALVTTLGSGMDGGSVYILNLNEPLDSSLSVPLNRTILDFTSLHCTIWNADCNTSGTQAVLGTSQGAALINLESGGLSWVCRSKSDIFSQQFDHSGNIILCGFRNGAIAAVDVRQRQGSRALSTGLPRHKISYSPGRIHEPRHQHNQSITKRYFELKGNMDPSNVICMSSSVSSLVWLQSDEHYFLASSMDGYVKLYDCRLLQRGAVQSYEGHVNTHSHIQLGVDPSESLVMSGGEDGYARIWSIKSGELLFGTRISDSVVSAVCWPQHGRLQDSLGGSKQNDSLYKQCHSWGVWLGSQEGIFYMHGS